MAGARAGGAQDVENFRENIKAGYLPLPTDVTFEGIVKDYYFDTTRRAHRVGGEGQGCWGMRGSEHQLAAGDSWQPALSSWHMMAVNSWRQVCSSDSWRPGQQQPSQA